MIIKSFEPGITHLPVVLFRGRQCCFWRRKFFQDVAPYEGGPYGCVPLREQTGKGFHFLIIFDPYRFAVPGPGDIDEIIDSLSGFDPEEELIFSVQHTPFFIVSFGAFKSWSADFREDRELPARLRDNGSVRLIRLTGETGMQVLDVRKDLRAMENAVIDYQVAALTAGGVIIEDLGNFFVEGMIPIGQGTRISTGVAIKGNSEIGKDVHLHPHCCIENSLIGDRCILLPGSIVTDSVLEEHVQIGPYTHLRMGALVKKGAKMGNFVEMKKSVLGEGSKSMHLAYIGDAEVGKNVNIGAGTITCNYDGTRKHPTIIEDNVFIGSGTELVAPLVIRENSYVAAGSTITEEVPRDSLAVARQKQRVIPGWAARKRLKNSCPTLTNNPGQQGKGVK